MIQTKCKELIRVIFVMSIIPLTKVSIMIKVFGIRWSGKRNLSIYSYRAIISMSTV